MNLRICALIIGLVFIAVPCANATVIDTYSYDYQPNPTNLWNLDHNKFYICRIDDFAIPTGHTIQSATITIASINNWNDGENSLFIHLLSGNDFAGIPFNTDGIYTGSDGQGGGDNLNNYDGIWLDTYVDVNGSSGGSEPYSYPFSPANLVTLTEYAADGLIGIGFDPDCHFNNCGITLAIETAVPEPITIVLLALGAMAHKRKRRPNL